MPDLYYLCPMKLLLKISSKITSTDTGGYRYFFNGQEGDNEVFGEVANFGYEFRQYDSRLGRWWSVDPMNGKYPSMSPYTYCSNNPVILRDIDGNDWVKVNSQWQWNVFDEADYKKSIKFEFRQCDSQMGR